MSETIILLLAAGAASRFGGPKALALWQAGTLLSQALATARAVKDAQVIVVLGGHAEVLRPALDDTASVFNEQWEQGLGTSIACGTQAALRQKPGCLVVLPVDQPLVTAAHLTALIAATQTGAGCAFTRDGAVWGPPAAFAPSWFPLLQRLKGDRGLKAVTGQEDIALIDAPGQLTDIDTPADLARVSGKG